MTTSRVIQLVAGREIGDRLRNRAFVIGSAMMLVLVAAAVLLPSIFSDDAPPSYELGVVGEVGATFTDAATSAADAQDVELEVTTVDDEDAATAAVRDGSLDAVLLDPDTLLVADDVSDQLRGLVEQARQQSALLDGLADAGVDTSEAGTLLAGRPPVQVVNPDGTEEGSGETGQGIAFVSTVLLFLVVQINASTLLTGTIEEKSSRVVEVLLGSVRPWQLLAGKLTGMSLLAIGQLVLIVGVGLGANAAVGAFDLPSAALYGSVVAVVMFVVGFALYAALYAVAGSMASSLEDAQASAGPLGFLTVGAYLGTLLGVVPNPDTVFAQVLTYLPVTAPFATPARVTVGAMGPLEVAISAVVTAVAAVLAVRVAGRLYSAAILAGGKLTWREVWRAEPVGA